MRRPLIALALAGTLGAGEIELLEPSLVRQMEQMESAVDRSFRSADGTRPAAISATRGIYLPGYGAVFSVEVNLVPMANPSPFRRSYTSEEIRDLNLRKRAALGPLRSRMRDILIQEGSLLTDLPPDLQVTLAISLFHFPWEDRSNLPSQVVIGAPRVHLSGDTVLTTRYY
jgi:hypothetical protein